MVANLPGTCCDGSHSGDHPHHHHKQLPASVEMQHAIGIRFSDPMVAAFFITPLFVYGFVLVVAGMTGLWYLLLGLVGFIATTSFVYVQVSRQKKAWALPQPLCRKTLLFVFATLVVGFVVSITLSLEPWVKLALITGMLLYGVGVYYEYSYEYKSSQSASIFKWVSFVSTALLILVTVADIFNVFA